MHALSSIFDGSFFNLSTAYFANKHVSKNLISKEHCCTKLQLCQALTKGQWNFPKVQAHFKTEVTGEFIPMKWKNKLLLQIVFASSKKLLWQQTLPCKRLFHK